MPFIPGLHSLSILPAVEMSDADIENRSTEFKFALPSYSSSAHKDFVSKTRSACATENEDAFCGSNSNLHSPTHKFAFRPQKNRINLFAPNENILNSPISSDFRCDASSEKRIKCFKSTLNADATSELFTSPTIGDKQDRLKSLSFVFGREIGIPKPRCRKVLSFSENGRIVEVGDEESLLVRSMSDSLVPSTPAWETPKLLHTPQITIKKISRAEAHSKLTRSPFIPLKAESQSPSFHVADLNSSPMCSTRSNFILKTTSSPEKVDCDPSLDELERELLSSFYGSTPGEALCDLGTVTKDSLLFDENIFVDNDFYNAQPSSAQSVCEKSPAKRDDDDSEVLEYRRFIASLRSPPSNFVASLDAEDSDIWEDASSDAEDDDELESDTMPETTVTPAKRRLALENLVNIPEKELVALYEENAQSFSAEKRLLKEKTGAIPTPTDLDIIMTPAQVSVLQQQMQDHLQLLIQMTGIVADKNTFETLCCTRLLLQMIFEFKYYRDLFVFSALKPAETATTSIFDVPVCTKLTDFYMLLKEFIPNINFVFKKPPKHRIISEEYPQRPMNALTDICPTKFVLPMFFVRILELCSLFFDNDLALKWNASRTSSRNPEPLLAVAGAFAHRNAGRCRFFPAEDDLLLIGLKRYCTNWDRIANKLIPSKTPKQLYVRYKNLTNRRATQNPVKDFHLALSAPLSDEEQQLLYRGVHHLGKDFVAISRTLLPYRTPAVLRRLWLELDQARRLADADLVGFTRDDLSLLLRPASTFGL